MDQTSLHALFDSAVADRPQTPQLVANSIRAGRRLRTHRRVQAAAASTCAVVLIAVIIPLVLGRLGDVGRLAPRTARSTVPPTAYVWTGTNAVTPIRLGTNTALKPIRFRGGISNVVAAPDGKAVYVFTMTISSSVTDYVTRIDTLTGQAASPIRLTGGLQQLAQVQIAVGGNVGYSIEYGLLPNRKYGTELVQINLSTGVEHRVIASGTGPYAISPNGRTAYQAGYAQGVACVDLLNGRMLRFIQVSGGTAGDVAIAPNGRTAYATSFNHGIWVTPIDTRTNMASLPSDILTAVRPFAEQIAIAADGKTGYLSDQQYVIPISLGTGRALKPIRLAAQFSTLAGHLEISPNSRIGYDLVLTSRWLQPVDLVSGTALPKLFLPPGSGEIALPAFAANGAVLYVPAESHRPGGGSVGEVFPVQTATQKLGKGIKVSGVPEGIVIVS